ncbi:uncharacterized protein LOC118101637 [Hippoglossus stenolepis]|uniref:uncharacterized protein LOC118101637 n=1 Tax=Hippoglossus stenolepis TaxID=195615 RepID=UPI00159C6EA7|nr:uncharacterized protein LOC118101637 [Hippoglossus stenolepis]
MNSFQFSSMCLILVTQVISFGHTDDTQFSICWMSKNEALERHNGNLWLNRTTLKSIRRGGRVNSLTVHPAVANKLTLKYGGTIHAWTLTISPSIRLNKIKGLPRPLRQPTNATESFLDSMSPTDVFACENGTVFFYQGEDFFLAAGHTLRLPVKIESRSSSMLLLSWLENSLHTNDSHTVTLYRTDPTSYAIIGMDSTRLDHYQLIALDSCSPYVACVEIAGSASFTCLSALTDPDIPKDFEVMSWNSSSISLTWDCPENLKYSLFLLTTFYLNGTDHVTEEERLWLKEDGFAFTLSGLQPCSRVRFGLQTVCQLGVESHYSEMILNDGNSVYSNIWALSQSSFGPDNYTLSWEVTNASFISRFRVYNDEALHGTTLETNYTVGGLLSCQQYEAKVEALCGEAVLMSTKTVTAHTGPHGVSELSFRSNDSTAVWTPGTSQQSAVAFLYELSLENGTAIQSSRVADAELRLPRLDEGKTYVLEVWEECDGEWESEHSQLCFQGANSSLGFLLRSAGAAGPGQDLELEFDFYSLGLVMVVPWSLPEDLEDEASEPREKMKKIFKDKLLELLKDFDHPARVELATVEPAEDPDKTEILFMSFDASQTDEDVPLPVDDQLDHIRALNATNITVRDGVIHWDGQDLCSASKHKVCPRNSLCINTLGSFTCVCKHGFYDVRAVSKPWVASKPICNENGLFSHCLDKLMSGGIAKPYLTSYIGGKVDVRLNDGRCSVDESETFYYFRTSRKSSQCGTERRVNKTHIEYQNTLMVTLTKEEKISRRDLKVVWRCVYPRHYIRNAQVGVDMEWLSSHSLVEFNSSLQLYLTMTLFTTESYTNRYTAIISLEPEDVLFFQVALQTNNTFASDVLLQVESCWATESTDPQDAVQGFLLQDGCPVDNTLYWLSVNGREQRSRFSVQMFTMPKGLHIYIHCLANICAHDQDCTKNCSSQPRSKRSVIQMNRKGKPATVVSAGPLLVNNRAMSGDRSSHWMEHMKMIFIVGGLMGFLGIAMLSVIAIKAIMTYYKPLQQQ